MFETMDRVRLDEFTRETWRKSEAGQQRRRSSCVIPDLWEGPAPPNGVFYLASEVKAFIELGVPLHWDLETLYDVQFFGHPPDRSPFAGIYQLPPGCYLLTDGQHVRVMPYWDWDFPLATDAAPVTDEREYVERVRHALEEAVRLRLRADVPVACYLSGGIDSCAILGLASRLSSKPLRAYTLSFDHAEYDERPLAEAQAKLSGAEFHRVDIRSEHTRITSPMRSIMPSGRS